MPFVCSEHNVAFPEWRQFHLHWLSKHKGVGAPERDEVWQNDVPEGVDMRSAPSKTVRKTAVRTVAASPEPPEIEELPSDPPELFHTLLNLKGIQEPAATRLAREFRLSSWMWGDAQEIAALLRGAKLNVSPEWIRGFLKQYGNTVEMPSASGEIGFVGGGRRQRDDFFGSFESQRERTDPLTTYLRYQASREDREGGRYSGPDPATEERIKTLESTIGEMMDSQRKLMEMLEKQEQDKERSETEARFRMLEDKITAKRGQGEEENTSWFKAWMEEREKRHEGTVSDLHDKLVESNKRIADVVSEARTAAREAAADRAAIKKEVKAELEEAGYSSRARTTEERVFDLAEGHIAPGIISEVRAGRQLLERAITGAAPEPGAPSPVKPPVTPEEAAKLAALLDIEHQLKEL